MAGKREEVRGVSALDIKKINDNFKWLWQMVFGNINFSDINQAIQKRIAAVENKANSNATTIKNHTEDTVVHVTQSNKDNWNGKANGKHYHNWEDIYTPSSFNPTVTSSELVLNTNIQNIINAEVIRIGNIVHLYGEVRNNTGSSLTGEVLIATIPTGFRPLNKLLFQVRTIEGIAKLNIYSNGEVKLDLTAITGYISALNNLATISLTGIMYKGE